MPDSTALRFESIELAHAGEVADKTLLPGISAADLSAKALDQVLASMSEVADKVGKALDIENGPDQMAIELTLSVSAEGNVCVAKVTGEGSITCLMTWDKAE